MKDYQKTHVIKWKQSGLSMQGYCREHEISYWSFREWKSKFESENTANKNGLVEISAKPYPNPNKNEPIEIILNNGMRIIVRDNSGIGHLKEIVCTLAAMS